MHGGISCMYARILGQVCLTLCNPVASSSPAPLSMGFSRQEYWSGLPWPPPVSQASLSVSEDSISAQHSWAWRCITKVSAAILTLHFPCLSSKFTNSNGLGPNDLSLT